MVSKEKQKQMRHEYNTQTNESLNMRNAEFAPKSINFSRTDSLKFRIQNVIGIHNVGYHSFYTQILKELHIPKTTVLNKWLLDKDISKQQSTKRNNTKSNKRKRQWKRNDKTKEELYLERTRGPKDGTYGRCIGIGGSRKRKKSAPRMNCQCGGKIPHKNKNSKNCLFPKR